MPATHVSSLGGYFRLELVCFHGLEGWMIISGQSMLGVFLQGIIQFGFVW